MGSVPGAPLHLSSWEHKELDTPSLAPFEARPHRALETPGKSEPLCEDVTPQQISSGSNPCDSINLPLRLEIIFLLNPIIMKKKVKTLSESGSLYFPFHTYGLEEPETFVLLL